MKENSSDERTFLAHESFQAWIQVSTDFYQSDVDWLTHYLDRWDGVFCILKTSSKFDLSYLTSAIVTLGTYRWGVTG